MCAPLAEQTAALLFGWLRQLDVRDATITIPGERNLFRSVTEARRAAVDKLRLIALILGEFVADDLKAYLTAISGERDSYKFKELRTFSKVIAPVAPAELAALILASLIESASDPAAAIGRWSALSPLPTATICQPRPRSRRSSICWRRRLRKD